MRKIGFRAKGESGGTAAIVVEWPLHWSEKDAQAFLTQVYAEAFQKLTETFE